MADAASALAGSDGVFDGFGNLLLEGHQRLGREFMIYRLFRKRGTLELLDL
jgi:hypothetical protein